MCVLHLSVIAAQSTSAAASSAPPSVHTAAVQVKSQGSPPQQKPYLQWHLVPLLPGTSTTCVQDFTIIALCT